MTEKILIVDDDQNLAEMMKRGLVHAGYQVVIANDGKQALRTFYEERPDLAILDVMMPYLNGFEVCQRIREMADIPILMLTAKDSEDDILKAMEMGATDYLSKTFNLDILIKHAGVLLERSRFLQS